MLHIILFLLKLIGWILLAILVLLVLLICVLLFTPLRYRVQADCAGDWKKANVNVRFSFLLHLLCGTVTYTEEKLIWKFRIAWKKLGSEAEDVSEAVEDAVTEGIEEVKEELTEVVEEQKEDSEGGTEEAPQETMQWEAEQQSKAQSQTVEEPEEQNETTAEQKTILAQAATEHKTEKVLQAQEEKPEDKQRGQAEDKQKESLEDNQKKNAGDEPEEQSKEGFLDRMECTSEKICDKINSLSEKKDFVVGFLTDEVHKAAFMKVLAELKKLLRKLAFDRIHADFHFGFEDPATTGYVLAFLSVCYPLTGEHIKIQPEFEQKVLEGDIFIKGKLSIAIFVTMVWNLLWNRNVRMTIRHVWKLKKQSGTYKKNHKSGRA